MTNTLPQITAQDKTKYQKWWHGLTDNWKKAFNQAGFQKGESTADLSLDEIHQLWHSAALRFAGPQAMHPNLTFDIGNLEGVKELENLKTLIAISSGIKSLASISNMTQLEALFVHENELEDLTGIEQLKNLGQLYCQNNKIQSLKPLKELTNLETVVAFGNRIDSLKGITEKHSRRLTNFYILPNAELPQKEIIKMESRIGIRCLRG